MIPFCFEIGARRGLPGNLFQMTRKTVSRKQRLYSMLTAGLDLGADSAYTAKAHPGLPQPSRPVLALNFCRILFLLTPPQCQSPSGFAFLRNLGKGLEVYYYVLFSIVNFMSACLVSLEKAPTSSEKQALCLFFYLSQN